ncbi:MAG: DUF3421 domain-containing protein [Leptospira sp.]|nr:DUF3421 domain-containing protein [Leptospira sp.]
MKRLSILCIFCALIFTNSVFAQDKWVPGSNGKMDGLTLIGGTENGKNLFLCAGFKAGTYHPGKIVGQSCNFGWGGREIVEPSYFTLQVTQQSVKRYSWHNTGNGILPDIPGSFPILVGVEGNRKLYVCRANYRGGIHPGKIVGNTCNFGWGGTEVTIPNYQILLIR